MMEDFQVSNCLKKEKKQKKMIKSYEKPCR